MFFMTIMSMFVSLGSYSLATLNTRAKHIRLELCSRDYDSWNTHNPESLEGGIGVMGRRPSPGLNLPKQGDVIPNLLVLRGNPALQDGEEVRVVISIGFAL